MKRVREAVFRPFPKENKGSEHGLVFEGEDDRKQIL